MFDFLIDHIQDDIKDYAGYLMWNDRIKMLNQQYHNKFHLNKSRVLYCKICVCEVVNFREWPYYDKYDGRIYDMRGHKHCGKLYTAEGKRVILPSNY